MQCKYSVQLSFFFIEIRLSFCLHFNEVKLQMTYHERKNEIVQLSKYFIGKICKKKTMRKTL